MPLAARNTWRVAESSGTCITPRRTSGGSRGARRRSRTLSGWLGTVDDVAEEVLVAEVAQPAEDVLGLEDVDAGAQRHRERELVDVERERRLAARVEEAIDVAADVVRELVADELHDGVDVAGLEASDDRDTSKRNPSS